MLHRILLADILCLFANDNRQLHFPVRFPGVPRDYQIIIRSNDGSGALEKENGLRGDRHSRFLRMIRVVQAHTHDLARSRDTRPQTHACIHRRSHGRIHLHPSGQPLQPVAGKESLIVIRTKRRDIDAASIVEEDTGFFVIRGAEADEFHEG